MHEISTRAHLFTLMESTRMDVTRMESTRMEFSQMESTWPHFFTRITSTWVHSYTRIISIRSHVLTSRPIVTDVQSAIIWVFKSTPNSLPLLFWKQRLWSTRFHILTEHISGWWPWSLQMSQPIKARTGWLVGVLGQQHIKSWLDPFALYFNFIPFPLANFWTLGLDKSHTSIFLALAVAPRVSDSWWWSWLSPCHWVACQARLVSPRPCRSPYFS